jgi:hypothetical protein
MTEMHRHQLARRIVYKYQQHTGLGSILEPAMI